MYNLRRSFIYNLQGRSQFWAICSIWNRSSLITGALIRFHQKWDAHCVRKGFKWKNKVCIIAKCFCQYFLSSSEKESNSKQSVEFWTRAMAILLPPIKVYISPKIGFPPVWKRGLRIATNFADFVQSFWFGTGDASLEQTTALNRFRRKSDHLSQKRN